MTPKSSAYQLHRAVCILLLYGCRCFVLFSISLATEGNLMDSISVYYHHKNAAWKPCQSQWLILQVFVLIGLQVNWGLTEGSWCWQGGSVALGWAHSDVWGQLADVKLGLAGSVARFSPSLLSFCWSLTEACNNRYRGEDKPGKGFSNHWS